MKSTDIKNMSEEDLKSEALSQQEISDRIWEKLTKPSIIEKIGAETWNELVDAIPGFEKELREEGNKQESDLLAKICKLTYENLGLSK